MAKIIVNNPRQVINGGAKKYYFKVKGLGGPKGDKGDTGATGPQGPQGPQGNAATVSVGSTTTLPVGYDATVTNTGSIYNAVLNFGIPQGPRGPQGATGATGAKGDKGDQGNPGPQGEKGTNATVYVGTTTTTNPGTQARVYNSGTDSNAVLNFEIPRGDVGPSVPLVQETGNSTTKAMSQNATTEALNGKQNTLTAGSNIQISGSTISATDTKYSAGNGITLTGTQFSANTSVLATKNDLGSYYTKTQIDSQMAAKQDDLVAGSNIQIAPDGKTISATDTTYTAGTGLTLTGTEFSADTTVLATQTDLTTALAPKLEAEVVAELPTTGEEGRLYLTPKAHTTQTATGNPITATVAEEAGAIESFQLDGDTFQQTYTGKNLFNAEAIPYVAKRAYSSDGSVVNWTNYTGTDEYQPVKPNTEYTIWNNKARDTTYLCEYDENKNFIRRTIEATTFTTTATTKYLRWSIYVGAGEIPPTQTQLELGSTSTPYEPYVGGTPSPNPEYPQPIQTVTGTQTISINGTNYPLDLGDIQLCGLGDDGAGGYLYKDRIYKNLADDKWYLQKEIGKVTLDGSENVGLGWTKLPNVAPNTYYLDNYIRAKRTDSTNPYFCNYFKSIPVNQRYVDLSFFLNISSRIVITYGAISSVEDFKAWLAGHPTTLYYALFTPTDTVITDQNLIAQLEAIRTASLENGTNTITNTATGTNLAGDMEIGYYGFAPRNRYDKWLWLDINNEYEQIGS